MEKYSKILISTLMVFTSSIAIASEPPIEATAATEAQQVALEYGNKKDQKSDTSDE